MLHIRLFCEAVFPTASGTGTVGGLEYAPVYHNHDPDSQATAPTHLSDMYKSNDEVGLPTNTHCVGALGLGRAWDRKRLGFRYALPLYRPDLGRYNRRFRNLKNLFFYSQGIKK